MRYKLPCLVIFAWCCLSFCPLSAAEKPDPRATVESALDNAIQLFERKEYAKFFQDSVLPQDRDKMLQGSSVEDFLKKVSADPKFETHSQEQIAQWKQFKTKTPVYNESKTEAVFPEIMENGATHSLTFEKQGELWLISIFKSGSTKSVPAKSAK